MKKEKADCAFYWEGGLLGVSNKEKKGRTKKRKGGGGPTAATS